MDYYESNPCYDSNYSGFDQIEPSQCSVNPSLNIQNELNDHELFINELIQQKSNENALLFLAIAITLDLPTVEPEDSLRMGDEHLNTIPETKSDEFIKPSVENLVPNPSEYEDECECDVPACDDFTTFSNLLFDADDNFSSSDKELFSDEDISKEIYSNPFLWIDEIDYDPEEEIHLIEKLLYDNSSHRPLEEFISENSDATIESFSPSPIPVEDSDSLKDEIDLTLSHMTRCHWALRMMTMTLKGIFLSLNNCLAIIPFHFLKTSHFILIFHHPSPLVKPLDDDEIEPNSGILTIKMVGDISEHYVPMPRRLPTQPTLVSNQEKSPHLISHRGLKAF
nr:hypothetical protein [Tanacetum cinerariifolium]